MTNAALWVPVIVAVVAPIFTYLGLRRKMSGTVMTSDADVLWKESSDIRAMLTKRIEQLESRLDDLGKSLNALTEESMRLRAERDSLKRENETLKSLLKRGGDNAAS